MENLWKIWYENRIFVTIAFQIYFGLFDKISLFTSVLCIKAVEGLDKI